MLRYWGRLRPLLCVYVWKEELPPNVAQTLSRQSSLEPKKKRVFCYMSTLLLLLGKAIAAAAAIAVAAVTAAAAAAASAAATAE